jgi:hypothetical protein
VQGNSSDWRDFGRRRNFFGTDAMHTTLKTLCLSLSLAAGQVQAATVVTYNTGTLTPGPAPVLAPNTSVDLHYTRVSTIGSGTTPGTVLGAALVETLGPGAWLAPGPNSEWIIPGFNYDGTVPALPGTHYYQTSFNLTGYNVATAVFTGGWLEDDGIGAIYLNGIDLNVLAAGSYTTPVNYINFAPFTLSAATMGSGAFNAGMNYLTFEVFNVVGPTGLRVEYRGDAQLVPEPGSYALMGLGLAAIGVARRRQWLVTAAR